MFTRTLTETISRYRCVPLLLLLLLLAATTSAQAQSTIIVDSTDDSAEPTDNGCNLREALDKLFGPGGDDCTLSGTGTPYTITFNLPGDAPHVFSPATPYPTITGPVIIDGSTQPGNEDVCLLPIADRPAYQVVIDGSNLSAGDDAFVIDLTHANRALGATIRGLNIRNVPDVAIEAGLDDSKLVIACNFIGTDETGLVDQGNGTAIRFNQSGGFGDRNLIGGTGSGDGNLISGNGNGIWLGAAREAIVRGNYIGTNKNGTQALGNSNDGVRMDEARATIVGGGIASGANVISGNGRYGVFITGDGVAGNVVRDNVIGTDAGATLDLGNASDGVRVAEGGNTIGGTGANHPNIIAYNGGSGIAVTTAAGAAAVPVRRNVVFSNEGIGIDLVGGTEDADGVTANDDGDGDDGANKLQNFPALSGARLDGSDLLVTFLVNTGSANASYPLTVDFFLTDSDDQEGMTYVGTASYAQTDATNEVTTTLSGITSVSVGDQIVATATDADGYTSEFSAPVAVLDNCLIVTTTADEGAGSLREAITCANDLASAGTITFDIPGDGPHVIAPLTQLPEITDPVVIDGATQPGGETVCTTAIPDRPAYKIIVDGSLMTRNLDDGFRVQSSDVTIRGLNIRNVPHFGISVEGEVSGFRSECNFIGTNETGLVAQGSSIGVYFRDASSGGANVIGGTDPAQANLISGNGYGVYISNWSTNTVVQGNYIGTDKTGETALGNTYDGVQIWRGATGNLIGGTEPGARNVISGNGENGVNIDESTSTGNTVQGNYIGTDANGTADLHNGLSGVRIESSDNTVGGLAAGAANTIAYNSRSGIRAVTGTGNAIEGNRIYSNVELGIDIFQVDANDENDVDEGANRGQNTPELAFASLYESELLLRYAVDSAPANQAYPISVVFYLADADGEEGMAVLGATTYEEADAQSTLTLTMTPATPVSVGDRIVATATDADGNTSEFSAPVTVGDCLVVTTTADDGAGSLREAITCANTFPGADTISFNIPGDGPHVIALLKELPGITDPATIDGSTQPGNEAVCTTAIPDRPTYQVVLDGTHLPGQFGRGLQAQSNDVTIRGLNVRNMLSQGISIDDNISGVHIACNFIGTDETGLVDQGNRQFGIYLPQANASGAPNVIGGTDPGDGNLISANQFGIVSFFNTRNAIIQGNYIGTDKTGETALGNDNGGIRIWGGGKDIMIGGTEVGAGNVISGNGGNGVSFEAPGPTDNFIQGNYIGTDVTGTVNLGNANNGLQIEVGGNTVGGLAAGAGNTIAFNGKNGIFVTGGSGNSFEGNNIFSNDELGIDLNGVTANDEDDPDGGVNRGQNTPELAFASLYESELLLRYAVDSAPANQAYPLSVVFYLADADATNPEGMTVLGATTYEEANAQDEVTFTMTLASLGLGDRIVATATDADGNTSEFSAPVTVASPLDCLTVLTAEDAGPGSLRAALACANATAEADTIAFDITGDGPHIITLASPLPTLSAPVVLDGTTQPGNEDLCTTAIPDRPAYQVAIDGGDQLALLYLAAGSDGSTIRGLNLRGNGVPIYLDGSNNATIACNFLGTDETGTLDASGTPIFGAPSLVTIRSASGTTVGGTDAGQGNLLAGASSFGVYLGFGTSTTRIQHNFVGTNKGGSTALPNGGGIGVATDLDGTTESDIDILDNLISGNDGHGIELNNAMALVQRNIVGLDGGASVPVGNTGVGVLIRGESAVTVGGTADGVGNTIASNSGNGITILGDNTSASVVGNLIYENGSLGIDLGGDGATANDAGDADAGPNGLQNYPVLSSSVLNGSDLTISYLVSTDPANATYPLRIDFFKADADGEEGKTYLGSDVYTGTGGDYDSCGSAPCTKDVMLAGVAPEGLADVVMVVATATTAATPTAQTSEFSAAVTTGADCLAVTTTADAGTGSLREAITCANNQPGLDTITFFISGDGPHVITPQTALPEIIDPVIIDGATQPGNEDVCTAAIADRSDYQIVLDGAGGDFDGLLLSDGSSGSAVRGLNVRGFGGYGLLVLGFGGDSNGHTITCNFIGTDETGLSADGNESGIGLVASGGNTVGGTEASAGNLVAGNDLDALGHGIFMLTAQATGNAIQGNFVGTDKTGSAALANGGAGIYIDGNASGNTVGGTEAGAGNTIAYNGTVGITDVKAGTGNVVRGNAIFSNNGLGIDLGGDGATGNDSGDDDSGANNLQNHPEISAASFGMMSLTVSYRVPTATANAIYPLTIDFYRADADGEEGQTYLGTTTYEAADAQTIIEATVTTTVALSEGDEILATATDANGNTSEFSPTFTPSAFSLSIAASLWLEGPWNGTDMDVNLTEMLPQADPYGLGQSVVASDFFTTFDLGTLVVDWVWLQLRSDETTVVASTAALLMYNGSVKASDAASDVRFDGVAPGSYYLVVGHRTTLAVMSASAVDCTSGSCTYDFRTAMTQAYGTGAMIDLAGDGSGSYALVTGDADQNGQVQASDKNAYFSVQVGQSGYREADFDLNGQVQASDKNAYFTKNVGKGSQVPASSGPAMAAKVNRSSPNRFDGLTTAGSSSGEAGPRSD